MKKEKDYQGINPQVGLTIFILLMTFILLNLQYTGKTIVQIQDNKVSLLENTQNFVYENLDSLSKTLLIFLGIITTIIYFRIIHKH